MNATVLTATLTSGSSTDVVLTGAGFAPKAVLLLGAIPNADGSGVGAQVGIGFATGASAHGSAAYRSIHGRTASVVSRSGVSSASLHRTYDSGGTLTGACSVKTLDADGLTLQIDTAFPTTHGIALLLLGGGDCSAKAGTFQLATATGTQAVTGVGFQPNVILLASAHRGATTINAVAGTQPGVAFGWAAGGAQACLSVSSGNATGTVEGTESWLVTNAILVNDSPSSSLQERATFSSFDADGFTLNKTANNGTTGGQIAYLALHVPAVATGTTAARTDTNTTALSTPGITPRALLMTARPPATSADSSAATGAADMRGSIGVATDATHRASLTLQVLGVGTVGGGNPTETFCRMHTDAVHTHDRRTSANTYSLEGALDVQSFDAEGVTLVQDDADSVASLLPYLVLGDATAPPAYIPTATLMTLLHGAS